MPFRTLLRYDESDFPLTSTGAELSQRLASYWKSFYSLWKTGYAQLFYNSSSPQWAVISLNYQLTPDQAEGINSWK